MAPQKGKDKQTHSSKSRYGCITCKKNKIKCDEAKPQCLNCINRGVLCGGYTQTFKFKDITFNSGSAVPVTADSKTINQKKPSSSKSKLLYLDELESTNPKDSRMSELFKDAALSITGKSYQEILIENHLKDIGKNPKLATDLNKVINEFKHEEEDNSVQQHQLTQNLLSSSYPSERQYPVQPGQTGTYKFQSASQPSTQVPAKPQTSNLQQREASSDQEVYYRLRSSPYPGASYGSTPQASPYPSQFPVFPASAQMAQQVQQVQPLYPQLVQPQYNPYPPYPYYAPIQQQVLLPYQSYPGYLNAPNEVYPPPSYVYPLQAQPNPQFGPSFATNEVDPKHDTFNPSKQTDSRKYSSDSRSLSYSDNYSRKSSSKLFPFEASASPTVITPQVGGSRTSSVVSQQLQHQQQQQHQPPHSVSRIEQSAPYAPISIASLLTTNTLISDSTTNTIPNPNPNPNSSSNPKSNLNPNRTYIHQTQQISEAQEETESRDTQKKRRRKRKNTTNNVTTMNMKAVLTSPTNVTELLSPVNKNEEPPGDKGGGTVKYTETGGGIDTILPLSPSKFSKYDKNQFFLNGFDRYTSKVLCIYNDTATNPWISKFVPIVQDYPILNDLLAMITCFHISKGDPDMKRLGMEFMLDSFKKLALGLKHDSLPLDVTLASCLLLSLGEIWDDGVQAQLAHLKSACYFIKKKIKEKSNTQREEEEVSLTPSPTSHENAFHKTYFNFLFSAWQFMKVLSKASLQQSRSDIAKADIETINYGMTFKIKTLVISDGEPIDHILGLSQLLFTYMDTAVEIINFAKDLADYNYPAELVKESVTIYNVILNWVSDLSFTKNPELTNIEKRNIEHLADYINISKSYKLSILIMLQNTFPQLPITESSQRLGIKVMELIDAIDYDESPTLTVHIFPLFIAGCEVATMQGKNWFRRQLDKLYSYIWAANIRELKVVMEESWKRKSEMISDDGFEVDDLAINGIRSRAHWYQIIKENNMEIFLG